MHPTTKVKHHQFFFQMACTVCKIIDRPKSTKKTIPAARDGVYPYGGSYPGINAWHVLLSACLSAKVKLADIVANIKKESPEQNESCYIVYRKGIQI
jgi:hypothetical protein